MNVLLINPWIYDFAAYDMWIKPVGLLHLASFIEKFGYQVSLIDCLNRHDALLRERYKIPPKREFDCGKFFSREVDKPFCLRDVPRRYKRYGLPPELFDEKLSRLGRPDAVGITSGMTYWYPGMFEAIKRVRKIFSRVPIILGGIYATLCPEHAKRYSGADFVVQGKGEIPLLKILDRLTGVKRNYCEVGQQLKEDTILPAYHLTPHIKSAAILTSRGCPFGCSYCASGILENCFVQRKPERLMQEISYLTRKFGVQDIAFYDDALLVNPEHHIIPLLERIIKDLKGKVRFHTPNGLHVKFIDRRVAKLMYDANFKTIRLSFESTSPRVQKESSSKVKKEDLARSIENLSQAGYKKEDIGVYILVGLPEQNVEEVIHSIEFVKKMEVKVKLAQFSPIPGTGEFEKATRMSSLSLEEEPLYHNNSCFYLWNKNIGYEKLTKIKDLAKI